MPTPHFCNRTRVTDAPAFDDLLVESSFTPQGGATRRHKGMGFFEKWEDVDDLANMEKSNALNDYVRSGILYFLKNH